MTHYSSIPGIEVNVGGTERLLTLMAGSALLFFALTRKKKLPLALTGGALLLRGSTGFCPLYRSLDVDTTTPPTPVRVRAVVTVDLPCEQVYAFWRRFDNLPRFMKHLQSVRILDDRYSHWKIMVPGGNIDWVSRITSETRNEHLAWRSIVDSDIDHQGEVFFRETGNQGTELELEFSYSPPGGRVSAAVAQLLNPKLEEAVHSDLESFKEHIETSGLPTDPGSRSGRGEMRH